MQKNRRKVLILADLEKKLGKYERRIQNLSEEAYQVRQLIEAFTAKQPKPVEVVAENADVSVGK